MADERPKLQLIDAASVVVAPVLVMLMTGSLVFFLVEVLQHGRFEGRLHWTFGFYVFGAVLVARIAITQSRLKSVAYGVVLGGACFIALMAFVEYQKGLFQILGPVINIGLIALVWWAADKLTWDCTQFDDARKASGRGVLAAAGLDGTRSTTAAEDDEEFDPDRSAEETRKKKKKKEPEPAAVVGWFQKYLKFREWRRKKPHTPGVWVLYFALAAIPLFALGQAMIPADDSERRGATFWQMAVYIGSALGLLVTTTLMGLKRYLEDRKAAIPTVMTAAWLGLGALLIVAFIGVAALLPRPHSETPLFAQQKGGKLDRNASKYAQVKDNSAGKGDGPAGQRKEGGDGNKNAQGGKPGGKGEGNQSQGQGDKQGGNQSGGKNGEKGGGDGNKGNGDKNGGDKNNPRGNKDNKGNDQNGGKDGNKGNDQKGGDENGESEGKSDGEGSEGDGSDGKDGSNPLEKMSQGFEAVGEVVKWIVWIVLAVAVIGGGGYFLLKHFAQFTGWAKGLLDWFRGLFGKKPAKTKAEVEEEAAEDDLQRPPPFSAFENPFTDGTAKTRTARELAEYTFAAFDSWAWDRDLGRQPAETPSEFAARVAEEHSDLESPGKVLADLYVMAMFSRKDLPADAKKKLAAFWDALESEPAVR